MNAPRATLTAAAALIAAVSALPAHADLIENGSFESPVVPVGAYTNYLAGSTAITGWTVVGIDSAVTSGSFSQSGITFQAQEGAQFIDLAGITSNSKTSGVMQSFATSIGSSYEIKFYVGSATDGSNFFPTTVDLSINGGERASYFNPAAPTTSLDWKLFTVNFTATTDSTSLTFFNGGEANNFNGALDNVSVAVVPEPSTYALIALGLGAMVGAERLRRRQG